MPLLVRSFCLIAGLILILCSLIPGVLVYQAGQAWFLDRQDPSTMEIETDFGTFTPIQAFAAYGGVTLALFLPGIVSLVIGFTRKRERRSHTESERLVE
jgi:hypothetical protein